jgi:hypothetical protein
VNFNHFRKYLQVFKHFFNRYVNTYRRKQVHMLAFILSLNNNSPILSDPNPSQTKRLREIHNASIPTYPQLSTILRANNNDIIIMEWRFIPLPTQNIIILQPTLLFLLGQIAIGQNIILDLTDQKRLTKDNKLITLMSLINHIIYGGCALQSIRKFKTSFLSDDIITNGKLRAPIESGHFYLVF